MNELVITKEEIDRFLQQLAQRGRSESTLQRYRHDMETLYAWLPENKILNRERMERWKEDQLSKGYARRTINTRLSTVNSYLAFCGRRELQMMDFEEKPEEENEPELSRREYLFLLQAAREKKNHRLYLLIKVFGILGLPVGCLSSLTVEAVKEGIVEESRIPGSFQKELLDYCKEKGIQSGPVFLTRDGKPVNRTTVTCLMKGLSAPSGVAEEKINPRCLKKMQAKTHQQILDHVNLLVERSINDMIEQEQHLAGWE